MKRYFNYAVLIKDAIQHFRRFCRRNPAPSKEGDERVTLQVLHAAPGLEWVGFPSWPPAAATALPALLSADCTLHLSSSASASSLADSGRLRLGRTSAIIMTGWLAAGVVWLAWPVGLGWMCVERFD